MTWTFWNCQVIRDYYSSHWASSTCLNRSINCVLQYFTKFSIVNFLLHYFFMYLYTSIFVQFCFILYFIKNRKCFFSLADFFYLIVGMDHEQYNCSLLVNCIFWKWIEGKKRKTFGLVFKIILFYMIWVFSFEDCLAFIAMLEACLCHLILPHRPSPFQTPKWKLAWISN